MTDDLSLRRDMEKGARAKALLEDPVLVEAFEGFEAELMTVWAATRTADTEARERVWMAIRVLRKVKGALETMIADGTLAKREIDEIVGRAA